MKKKLLMLSVFALATTAMASATLKEEVSYNFEGKPGSVNVLESDGTKKMDGTTEVKEHPLNESHTPKAVTSLNIDTDLVKADLAFQLDRNFSYTNKTTEQLGETDKYRNVKNLTDGRTQHDMYGDAELTYKINDNLTAKGFLHYNENHVIKGMDDDPIHAAVKIGLDYNYAGVSGRGLLMAIKPADNTTWHGLSLDAKTNIGNFELTGNALGMFKFDTGEIKDEKTPVNDIKSIDLPDFYSELNLGAKYVNGALTSDNKLHYNSNIIRDFHKTENSKKNTKKVVNFELFKISKFWDKNHEASPLDLKLTSDNTYKFNDKVTLTGDAKLEHKINGYSIKNTTNSKFKPKSKEEFGKDVDYIVEVKPGVKYEDQMGALKLTATADSKISYDYGRKIQTEKTDKLRYKYYADAHKFIAKPGAEAKVEYKINDGLKATGHVGLGTDLEYIKRNAYKNVDDSVKVKYDGDAVTSMKGFNPSLGAGLEYINGSLTASVKANVSNVDAFKTISSHDKDGKPVENLMIEDLNNKKVAKIVTSKYALENKGTNVDLKADYKVNDQISAGAEASVNMLFSNVRTDYYGKDDKQVAKGDEVTTFQLTDNGLDGGKKAQTFFSVYGSYKPMSNLTTTATAKVELATTMAKITEYDNSKEDFPVSMTTKGSSIDLLKPSFELKADYTILKGLKLGAKTSIGAAYSNYKVSDDGSLVPGAYSYTYDKDGDEIYNLNLGKSAVAQYKKVKDLDDTEKKAYEKAVKDGKEIRFNNLTYSLGLTLSYEW